MLIIIRIECFSISSILSIVQKDFIFISYRKNESTNCKTCEYCLIIPRNFTPSSFLQSDWLKNCIYLHLNDFQWNRLHKVCEGGFCFGLVVELAHHFEWLYSKLYHCSISIVAMARQLESLIMAIWHVVLNLNKMSQHRHTHFVAVKNCTLLRRLMYTFVLCQSFWVLVPNPRAPLQMVVMCVDWAIHGTEMNTIKSAHKISIIFLSSIALGTRMMAIKQQN